MKKLVLICLIVVMFGCDNSSDDGGSSPASNGAAPSIIGVTLGRWTGVTYEPSNIFYIGDYSNFLLSARDMDLDIDVCYISMFTPADSKTPYYGPDPVYLPTQTATDMDYYLIEDYYVEGPAGDWRIEFVVDDAHDNRSKVYKVYAKIYD